MNDNNLVNLDRVSRLILDELELSPFDFKVEDEGRDYSACTYKIESKLIISRTAKLTPKKPGLFVAIWKRSKFNKPVPFNLSDKFSLLIINVSKGSKRGQFIFPKSILNQKGIVSGGKSKGKNGIRVYPSWDKNLNPTAAKTQKWQKNYFFEINEDDIFDKGHAKALYS
ncbi:MAG: MepB family protein [Bacteriovoracaceae bacterium]|nr:MepB family protein [Bacteriovoracaceae bacterium]